MPLFLSICGCAPCFVLCTGPATDHYLNPRLLPASGPQNSRATVLKAGELHYIHQQGTDFSGHLTSVTVIEAALLGEAKSCSASPDSAGESSRALPPGHRYAVCAFRTVGAFQYFVRGEGSRMGCLSFRYLNGSHTVIAVK